MLRIENNNIDRELRVNHFSNEIFKKQRHSDLDAVAANVRILNRDVVLELDINNTVPFCNNSKSITPGSKEDADYWNHSVSLMFMSQLVDKYFVDTNHDLDEERRVMTRLPIESYLTFEDALVNRNDVLEAISSLQLLSPRIHIVLKYMNNEGIWKELMNYLDKDISAITMIYTDGEVPIDFSDEELLKRICPCQLYDKDEDGVFLVEPKKEKGLKHEKEV